MNASVPVTTADAWTFGVDRARATLLEQLQVASLEGFGMEGRAAAVAAAGALVHYLRETQAGDLPHVRGIRFRASTDHLLIDPATLQHLEVVEALDGGRERSLLGTIDATCTVMGGRLLRSWLVRPLVAIERIQDRLDAVEELAFRTVERGKFREIMKGVADLERLLARAALGTAGPRDLLSLQQSATLMPRIRTILTDMQAPLVTSLLGELDDLTDVRAAIESTIADDPPALARDGGCIRDGADPELDELRTVSRGGRQQIADMEKAERGAYRHHEPQDSVQPGLRVLHRGVEV